jgi:alginate O-acetyltransferase complex protein AlgI
MLHLGSWAFVGSLAVVAGAGSALRHWMPTVPLRFAVLVVANVLMLGFWLDEAQWRGVAGLAAAALFVFAFARLAERTGQARWSWIGGTALAAAWLGYARSELLVHGNPVRFLGASYFFFKCVHVLAEAPSGKLRLRVGPTLLHLLWAPTLPSGPMARYRPFVRALSRDSYRAGTSLFARGAWRIVLGSAKCAVLAPALLPYATDWRSLAGTAVASVPALELAASLGLYSLYLYWDFSGICDVAIGVSALLGVRIPENFRAPYLSPDLSSFWRRWHMTLSSLLRDYVFLPSARRAGSLLPRLGATIAAYHVTFVACGLWHGLRGHYVLWGLWHALGLSILAVRRRVGARPLPRPMGIAVTFAFVTAGWAFFHYGEAELLAIGREAASGAFWRPR